MLDRNQDLQSENVEIPFNERIKKISNYLKSFSEPFFKKS